MMTGTSHDPRMMWFGVGYFGIFFTSLIYTILKYGQGGERYEPPKGADNDYQFVDDDQFWKWGIIYYNTNDPAIFVEKRFGIGITLNFAKWQAWAWLLGIFVFIGVIIGIIMFLERM